MAKRARWLSESRITQIAQKMTEEACLVFVLSVKIPLIRVIRDSDNLRNPLFIYTIP